MDIGTVSPLEIGAMLYHLQFPTRDFTKLPESVQLSYRSDAVRLLDMLAEATRS